MTKGTIIAALSVFSLAGCAVPGDQLSVNHSPYTVPVNIAEVDDHLGSLRYPGRGVYAFDDNGNRVKLSRRERRQLRARFRNVQAQIEQNERVAEFDAQNAGPPEPIPSEPIPSAPPVGADSAQSDSDSAASPAGPARGGGSLPR